MRQVWRWSWAPLLAAGALMLAFAGPFWAAGDGGKDKEFDKAMAASLKEVINHGARLFNKQGDAYGCYRVYDGGLRALRPQLAQYPDLQKTIDDALAAAENLAGPAERGFALNKALHALHRRFAPAKDKKVEIKDKEPDKDKKDKDNKDKDKDKDKKGKDKIAKDKEEKLPPGAGRVSGKVTFSDGVPAPSGYLTLVADNQAKYSAYIHADGAFSFKTPIPKGNYIVTIEPTLKDDPLGEKNVTIPAYYREPQSSPLRYEVRAGQNMMAVRLSEPGKKS